MLVRNPQNFLKDRVVQNSRWLLGTGLLTAEGDAWKRQRRLIQPAFSHDRIAVYNRCMTESAEQMLTTWRSGTVVDIHQEMMSLTLIVFSAGVSWGRSYRGLTLGRRFLMPGFLGVSQ